MNSFPQIEIELLKNLYHAFGVEVSVMRLDKIHSVVSGNKWFKLKAYLADAKALNKKAILTFGGAYSNHIIATAAACDGAGLKAIGVIRGEKPAKLSPTLQEAVGYGMQLHFVSREKYKDKPIPEAVWDNYNKETVYCIDEGGYGSPGCAGAATILGETTKDYTHIMAAVGTGTTLAGLVTSSLLHQQVIGISALKNNQELEPLVDALLPREIQGKFTILHDYHFGGYAKHTPELISFMNWWYAQTSIPSDFVYTGKLFFALNDLVSTQHFATGSKILVIHSGGLQGNRSLTNGTLIF